MILVLGGAGYIGSHAVRELLDRGNKVIVVDNLENGHIEAVDRRAEFYNVDIRDEKKLDNIFKENNIDVVVHFAANSLVGESMINPLKYYNNNLHGTEILLKVMIANNVKKIVFSSTAATYGDPNNIPIFEDAKTNPTNPYGETKLAMEKMMKWADVAHGIRYISLRYFNVAGAHESGEIGEDHKVETHIIPLVLDVALGKKESITIFGNDYNTNDGTCIRDYIHVMDLVNAHILAIQKLNNGSDSNIYNLGNEKGFTVREIINTAKVVTAQPIKEIIGKRRSGDPEKLVASSYKARKELNWTPVFGNIESIISSAWKWHKNHPNGYKGGYSDECI